MNFLAIAIFAGLGLALVAGPLGCLVVWRRMAYFGDTLAHASLLGVALGVIFSLPGSLATLLTSLLAVPFIVLMSKSRSLGDDTVLGILSHGSLALGLVVVSLVETSTFNINSFLFGDILALSETDLVLVGVMTVAISLTLTIYWRRLVSITIHEDLARVEGLPVDSLKWLFLMLLAVLIAIGMQIVGVLLITALLIIPAAAASQLARSPEAMAISASLLAMVSVLGGVALSWYSDSPTGPSIVVAALALYVALSFLRQARGH